MVGKGYSDYDICSMAWTDEIDFLTDEGVLFLASGRESRRIFLNGISLKSTLDFKVLENTVAVSNRAGTRR